MVARALACAAMLISVAVSAAQAQSRQDRIFPGVGSCYARTYSPNHLAKHPEQRVTQITLRPDFTVAKPMLAVHLDVTLRARRGDGMGGAAETTAYCDNEGADTLYCGMEGDTGGFQITPTKGGAILINVSSLGMMFETDTAFVTLENKKGDDRSFLLQPVACQ